MAGRCSIISGESQVSQNREIMAIWDSWQRSLAKRKEPVTPGILKRILDPYQAGATKAANTEGPAREAVQTTWYMEVKEGEGRV